MRVLVIGGTGFIGPFVIKTLVEQGHDVTVFHRGDAKAALPEEVRRIHGNRNDLAAHRSSFEQLTPDVVLDFILSDGRQATALMETFRGLTARVVAISIQDVYRAYSVLLGREPGSAQPTPLTEESEVRGATSKMWLPQSRWRRVPNSAPGGSTTSPANINSPSLRGPNGSAKRLAGRVR